MGNEFAKGVLWGDYYAGGAPTEALLVFLALFVIVIGIAKLMRYFAGEP